MQLRNFIWIGIIGVVVIGGLLFRDFLTGNPGDLKVGDCFDLPDSDTETVTDVQHHPCTDLHGGEVIFVGDFPGSGSDAYPSDDEMFAFLSEKCVPAYDSYTGNDIADQATYDIGWFQPTEEGWKDGDQGVSCYIYRLDETQFKGSLKAG
jgi:hypothetical protein